MHRSQHNHSVRIRGLAIAAVIIAAGAAAIGSCVFETRTTFCERFGVRCKEGQRCATDEAVCIDIGGCGDRIVDTAKGEVCDDGNTLDGDGCSTDCRSDETCGNGTTDKMANPPEECDLGQANGGPNEPCDAQCHIRSLICGNGIIDQDEGEQCDPGPEDSEDCNSSAADTLACKLAKCGDGYTNMAAGEMCDTGMTKADTSGCNGTLCTKPVCGDNHVNVAANEECESAGNDTQICNGKPDGPASCRAARCGDGYVNPHFVPSGQATAETCDLGASDTTMCNGNNGGRDGPGACQPPSCGDRYTNTALKEDCDNGGSDSPGCNGNTAGSASCKNVKCGDNHVNHEAGETCDSTSGTDTEDCNGTGGGSAACHASVCGDHYANAADDEDCDNGIDDSQNCNGTSAPKALRCKFTKCGDNYHNEAAEDCDDNNGMDTRTCNGSNAGDASCHTSRCGDHYLNKADNSEECESNSDCKDPQKPKCTACKCG